MKAYVLLFLLSFAALIAHTQTSDLHQIKLGMSEAEVLKLVGKPDKKMYSTINKITHDTDTYWDYSPEQTIYFKQHKVTRVEYNKDAVRTRMNASIKAGTIDTSRFNKDFKQQLYNNPK